MHTSRTIPRNRTRAASHLAAALALAAGATALVPLAPLPLAAQEAVQPVQAAGRVAGRVVDRGGLPVANAQVSVVGTRLGAQTDDDGRYAILGVPPGSYQVRAQRIGFAPTTQAVTVTDDQPATADFQLSAVATTLSTQVVVGYTTQQRRDVSDAVSSVAGADLQEQQVATVEEALRGRVPGVQIASSGEPGRAAEVIVRGQIGLGNPTPLYVVDGMYLQQNPNLNPDDIASIEVLKDASAAAQYGAQAANGVVVITTKRGSSGPNKVELRSYYGFQEVPELIDMMNATEWAALMRTSYENAGEPVPTGILNPTTSTDWQDAVFQRGAIQDYNLTMSGGSPTASYMLSGGVLDQTGAIIETGFRRYSFRVNSEARRGRFTFGENIALSRANQHGLNSTIFAGFPLTNVVRMLPTIPVRDPNNASGYGYGSDANPTFANNPVALQELPDIGYVSNQVIGTAYAELGLLQNLRYRFNLGVNYDDYNSENFQSSRQIRRNTTPAAATLSEFRSDFTSLLYENLLTYNADLGGGAHRITAVAGFTEQTRSRDTLTAYREGFSDEEVRVINAGGTGNLGNSGGLIEGALRSYLFRANYTLRDRYLLTGSARRDCSTRFGPDNRCGNFGAVSAGWVVSEEGFFGATPLLGNANFLKLRASYGVLGNQEIPDYAYAAGIERNRNYLLGNQINRGATQLSLANPNIKWQGNASTNVGLDLAMLDDRLNITADVYRSESNDVLYDAPLPLSFGAVGNPFVNAGNIRNSGFELGVGHRFERGDFQLNTSATFTTTKNKVLSLATGEQPIFDPSGVARTAVGGSVGEFYVRKTAGVFQSEAEIQSHTTTLANGEVRVLQPDAEPGDQRFVDVNRDGLINDDDRYNAGSAVPDFTYGLFFDAKFRRFDVGLNLRGSQGNEAFNDVRYWTDRGDEPGNFRRGYSPWTPTNPSTTTPRIAAGNPPVYLSDRWVEDASFLRVQNIVVGYTLPEGLLSRAGLGVGGAPRIYFNVQNAFTFTDYSNWDPETLGAGHPLGRGIDAGAIFPNVRTVTFGLDLRL